MHQFSIVGNLNLASNRDDNHGAIIRKTSMGNPPFYCSWMLRNIHERRRQPDGDHSLIHSILVNLFIKLELNNFLLPLLLSIVFV